MNIKCYELIEFESECRIVSAQLCADDGTCKNLIPFLHRPVGVQYDNGGIESIAIEGRDVYKLRFSVPREGEYTLKVTYADGESQLAQYAAQGFANRGFIKVSDRDSRYFSYSDGTTYYPIGINMAFPTVFFASNGQEFGKSRVAQYLGIKDYERWFRRTAENGVNLVRLWLGYDYFTPDTEDASVLSPEKFSKLDIVVSLAKKYGMKLKFTLEQFRYFRDVPNTNIVDFIFNKKLSLDGQPCGSYTEWLQEEKWRRAWIDKVRELSARYAFDPDVFAIELWNEQYACDAEFEDVVSWNRDMVPVIRELFPNTMVINSLGSLDSDRSLVRYKAFPWEIFDFRQLHRYLDLGARYEDCHGNPIEMLKVGVSLMKDDSAPFVVAETGAVNNRHSGAFKFYPRDDRGILFVDCVYTPVFLGCASCGHIWHWDSRYVEAKNLFRYFKPLADMLKDVDLAEEHFVPKDLSDEDMHVLLLEGEKVTLGFLRNKADCWQNVLRDDLEPAPIVSKIYDVPGAESVTLYPIWDDEQGKVTCSNGKLLVENLRYGIIFKLERH